MVVSGRPQPSRSTISCPSKAPRKFDVLEGTTRLRLLTDPAPTFRPIQLIHEPSYKENQPFTASTPLRREDHQRVFSRSRLQIHHPATRPGHRATFHIGRVLSLRDDARYRTPRLPGLQPTRRQKQDEEGLPPYPLNCFAATRGFSQNLPQNPRGQNSPQSSPLPKPYPIRGPANPTSMGVEPQKSQTPRSPTLSPTPGWVGKDRFTCASATTAHAE